MDGKTCSSRETLIWSTVVVLLLLVAGNASGQVDFKTELIPLFTRHGCNAGACHGSAAGRGGFKLSLYGSQPQEDYVAIALEGKGRRINRANAANSLLIRKPAGELEHGGNQLFDLSDEEVRLICNWIEQGATYDESSQLSTFDVGPQSLVIQHPNESHAFQFKATFSDGSSKNVTKWTVLTAEDPSSVKIDRSKNAAFIRRAGRHVLIARFLDQVQPIEVLVPFESETEHSYPVAQNFIDQLIDEKLDQLNLPPGQPIGDSEFLRRVSLDLTGRLPTLEQLETFLGDSSGDKRQRWIERLLVTEAFNDYWTHRLALQLRLRSRAKDQTGARVYHDWLRQAVAENRSWKEIASSLLLATGDSHQNGPANFYRTTNDARQQAEFVTESLLGVRLRCANCHDHPFDRWTQDDYHGLASVFATVNQSRFVTLDPHGENIHAKTGQPAVPRVPGEAFIRHADDLRIPFSKWAIDDGNPYFARSMVNRLWKALLGRGLVEPVDDLRSTNPATHPELLKKLADDFVTHQFDIRHTLKTICNSETYQRSVGSPDTPDLHRVFYANATIRRLSPEVLADSISDVIGVADSFPGQPANTRAVQLPDPNIPAQSLDVLGRCSREEPCENSSATASVGLATQLHLLNGELINQRITAPGSHYQRMLEQQSSVDEIVQFFYLKAFSRNPNEAEKGFWTEKLAADEPADQAAKFEDFVWSVLNSREFTTNH